MYVKRGKLLNELIEMLGSVLYIKLDKFVVFVLYLMHAEAKHVMKKFRKKRRLYYIMSV